MHPDVPNQVARLITEDPDVFEDDPHQLWSKRVQSSDKHGEIGWAKPIGDEEAPAEDRPVHGQKHDVKVPFKTDHENIIYHTHPVTGEPSPLRALPSAADLEVALKDGVAGIGIYNDYWLARVTPARGTRHLGDATRYEQALKNGDSESAVKELANLGFDVEIINAKDNEQVADVEYQDIGQP